MKTDKTRFCQNMFKIIQILKKKMRFSERLIWLVCRFEGRCQFFADIAFFRVPALTLTLLAAWTAADDSNKINNGLQSNIWRIQTYMVLPRGISLIISLFLKTHTILLHIRIWLYCPSVIFDCLKIRMRINWSHFLRSTEA